MQDFEVVIVDNESTDLTLAKVRQFPVKKIVNCTDYLPGKALNIGIRESVGEHIVCLSGHCIPTNAFWLENLYRNMKDTSLAGVYGRQEPMSFTPDADKRDMMVIFGPERKVQRKDSFFHNANSMIRRDLWEKYPFDDRITNIEDRIWAQTVQSKNYAIAYEPEASVYHYHGIHQNGNPQRCNNVVRILEHLSNQTYENDLQRNLEDLNIAAIIPIKGEPKRYGRKFLFEYTLERALGSRLIKTTVVSTDNAQIADLSLQQGADFAFMRDESLSRDYVGLEKVFQYTLDKLENADVIPDIVVLLEITYPFRETDLIDNMIEQFYSKGLDTILPAKTEPNAIWVNEKNTFKRIDEGLMPRKYKNPIYITFKGLCCVTRPFFIRNEQIIGDNIGIYTINNPYASMEIRNEEDFSQPPIFMENFI
jgi:CMP-N-acetylneuraminic acid synthetase